MKFEVYCITNLITNRKYIGITTQGIEERFRKHKVEASNGSDRYLCKAMRKYGFNSFEIELIDNSASNYEELLKKEIFYINKFNTFIPNGYNMTIGGEGTVGRKHTIEARKKISIKRIGFKYTEEQKEMFRAKGKEIAYWEGKKMPKEARKKMSEAKKGKKLSEETKNKRKYIYEKMKGENHPLFGIGHSEESKRKMSISKKGQGAVKYKAYNDDTEIIFNSLKDALVFLGVKGHASLIKSERNKTIYKGYYWKKIN